MFWRVKTKEVGMAGQARHDRVLKIMEMKRILKGIG